MEFLSDEIVFPKKLVVIPLYAQLEFIMKNICLF